MVLSPGAGIASAAGGLARLVAGSSCRSAARREGAAVLVADLFPTLAVFLPPSPRPRSQSALPLRGRGRLLVYFAGGWRPRHPCTEPLTALNNHAIQATRGGLNPGGTGEGWRLTCRRGARRFWLPDCFATVGVRRRAQWLWSPGLPALSILFCPHPPDPLPLRGRGRLLVYFAGGWRPRHPCAEPLTALAEPAGQVPGVPGNLRFAATPTEALFSERCRQPRRGGTGGEELRRLRWSSPPGQG